MSIVAMTTRQDAPALAREEYAALLTSLRSLPPSAWSAPTDCTGWTVRDVVAHVVGAAEEAGRPWVQARHYLPALVRDRGRPLVDKVNDAQLADLRSSTPEELVTELERLAPKAARGRQRLPGPIRRIPMPTSQGCLPGDTMGYLNDVIYTRDIWMHRVDIARATGAPMVESGAEREVVGQVVRDLSRAWTGAGFTLVLTGRVPGNWQIGSGVTESHADRSGAEGAATVTVDTVALCRMLSGRSDETALVADGVPTDLVARLRQTRVLF